MGPCPDFVLYLFLFSTVKIENQDSYFQNIEWGEGHDLTIQLKWSIATYFNDFSDI